MLDMQRNFMIGVMGGFSNYDASHVYSQHSKTQNGLVFDILDGIGSKIEKGTDLLGVTISDWLSEADWQRHLV